MAGVSNGGNETLKEARWVNSVSQFGVQNESVEVRLSALRFSKTVHGKMRAPSRSRGLAMMRKATGPLIAMRCKVTVCVRMNLDMTRMA